MQKFIASSKSSKELLNSASLLRDLNVNVLIKGEIATGKIQLAKHIVPNGDIYDAQALEKSIKGSIENLSNSAIIIKKVENIVNTDKMVLWANKNNIKVVATTLKQVHPKLRDFFHIILEIPSLKNRKDDVEELASIFKEEAKEALNVCFELKEIEYDLSLNAKSLRSSIYFEYIMQNLLKDDLMKILERYLSQTMINEEAKTYKELLSLFEIPLLRASKKIDKNQLQMAKKLNITRVTLRKKLDNYKDKMEKTI